MTVFLCVTAALALILLIPVRASVKLDPDPSIAVRWLFFKLPLPQAGGAKPPAPPKAEKKEQKKPKITKETLRKYLPALRDLLPRCLKPIRRLLRRTTVAEFELYITVAGEDAAQTAIAFGRLNGVVYPAVAALGKLFTLRVRQIGIAPDFTAEKGKYFFSGEIRLVPLAALAAACNLAVLLLISLVRTAFQRKQNMQSQERDVAYGKQASDQ